MRARPVSMRQPYDCTRSAFAAQFAISSFGDFSMNQPISLVINGRSVQAVVEPRTHLADFVRDALRLTGTHLGCEHGVCGACTVLIDGAPMRSCIAYAIACDGADVRTIEGFDDDPLMKELRAAFTRYHALQCGYCTPGMLVTAYDIVRRVPGADEARVREELSGNLCRCTGYAGIVEAVRSVLATPAACDGGLSGAPANPTAPAPRITNYQPATPDAVLSAPSRDFGPSTEIQHAGVRLPHSLPLGGTSSSSRQITAGREMAVGMKNDDMPSVTPRIHQSPGTPGPHASGVEEPIGSEHKLTLAIAPNSLWHILKDIDTVVRCLPGASLTSPPDVDPVRLSMIVALGPMRARFEGSAHVKFDDSLRTATIDGIGHDARTRSTSHGRIQLALESSEAGGSVLTLRLAYALRGPLAQFSRGAVVDAVVEQILEQFAANLASAAEGVQVASVPPPGALRMAAVALWRRLQRLLTSSDR